MDLVENDYPAIAIAKLEYPTKVIYLAVILYRYAWKNMTI